MREGARRREPPLVRPILKWAGGKRQLLPVLRPFYPARFRRYFEPFVGSGAVFLDLHNAGELDGHAVRLSDLNPDVIGCYRTVRDALSDVVGWLRRLEAAHNADGASTSTGFATWSSIRLARKSWRVEIPHRRTRRSSLRCSST